MKMNLLIFIYTLTIILRECTSQDIDNLDELIANTFGGVSENSSTTPTVSLPGTPSTDNNSGGNGNCICVPFYMCSTNRSIIENGEKLIDKRLLPERCNHSLDVCCETGFIVVNNETSIPTLSSPLPKPRISCGQRNFKGISSLNVTGAMNNEALFGEFPWMVAVTSRQQVEGTNTMVSVYQCGGSLLSPSAVLTAAHCVHKKTGLSVRAGEWDTQTTKEPLPIQVSVVREKIIHEQFNSETLHNDVALLMLETPLKLAPNVGIICLPEQGENMDGQECVVNGWGKDVFGKEGKYQVILKKVEMPTVPRDECLQSIQRTKRLHSGFTLHESFMCAGGIEGHDACTGDGGSPLACPSTTDSQVYVQAGIVAWGIDCGSGTPGVYVNVAHFRNWIDNKLSSYVTR